ncbi:MAG: hypothetical protein JKP96_06625 [Oceanicaulis sp.]|jgi:hypothetical protein|nr:hypothetical protein [Oceanicaulis sp.]
MSLHSKIVQRHPITMGDMIAELTAHGAFDACAQDEVIIFVFMGRPHSCPADPKTVEHTARTLELAE